VSQHASLSPERWARFGLDEQILMIANEMKRAAALMSPADRAARRRCYERVLRLVDLTVAVQPKPTLRRELLRWRDLVAARYLEAAPASAAHDEALRCLLRFTAVASRQIAFL